MQYCSRCAYREAVAKGRCRDCYRYWRTHGEERPFELIKRQHEKRTGRRLQAPAHLTADRAARRMNEFVARVARSA